MPRRNDIAKILNVAVAMALLFFVALYPPAKACTYSLDRIHVPPDFRVIVSHGETPIPGIQVEVYDEDERHHEDATAQRKPIVTLVTSPEGVAEIKNLDRGTYLVMTKGAGGGSAFYAIIGDSPDKIRNEITLPWPFSWHETLKTRNFSGKLLSNDPWKPFQNVHVELWAPGLEKPLAKEDTGPKGSFHFDVRRPGIYVLRVIGRQNGVDPDHQIEGELAVELDPSATDAPPSVALRLATSTCGIEYSNCSSSEATIEATSRRIQVRNEPGTSEYPGIENAKYRLLDDHGALIAEGATDHEGIAHLPAEFAGRATLIVAADSLETAVQQSLDLLPAAPGAPDIVVTMAFIGSSGHCSAVTLETHATQK